MNNGNIKYLKLGDIARTITKGTTPTTYGFPFTTKGINFYKVENLSDGIINRNSNLSYISEEANNSLERSKLQENDILFSIAGTIGEIAIVKDTDLPGNVNQALAIIRDYDRSVLPNYLFYVLKSTVVRKTIQKARGVALYNISLEDMKEMIIPVPSIEDQINIYSILMKADTLIKRRKETLLFADELLQSIFLEMFGDPVVNSHRYKDCLIGDYAKLVSSGSTPLGGERVYTKEGILFFRSQNVLMNEFDISDIAYISKDMHSNMKRTWLKNGDILLNITGASIGRVNVYRGEDEKANVNQHVCIIRLDENEIIPEFLAYFIANDNYQNRILSQNAGATRQAFNFEHIKAFKIFKPPIERQKTFCNIYRKMLMQKEKNKAFLTESENLFGSIMQMAFKEHI